MAFPRRLKRELYTFAAFATFRRVARNTHFCHFCLFPWDLKRGFNEGDEGRDFWRIKGSDGNTGIARS